MIYLVYHHIREEVKVSDIISGRYFTCKSVIALIEKEEELSGIATVFRVFLTVMKTWGGKEIIPIELPKEATQFLKKKSHAAH